MAVQERNSEMVSLLSADFIQKTDTVYLAGIITGCILALPGLVAFWPMGISLSDSNDIYADYAYSPGRSGGQTLNGGTAAGDDLTLRSTSNATKGNIFFGNSTYDEVNNYLGIGTTSPDGLQVNTPVASTARSADNVRMGVLSGLPTIILEESASVTQWIIDNNSGTFRMQVGSTTYLTIDLNSVWFLKNVGGIPGSAPTGGGYLFVDAGSLKYLGSSGTLTVVAPA